MSKPRFKLEDLSIDEGSLVGEGDNPEAHIRLFKLRADEATVSTDKEYEPRTMGAILAEREFSDRFWTLRCAYTDSIGSILAASEHDKMGALLTKTTAEFSAAVGDLIASIAKLSPMTAARARAAVESLKVACAAEPAAVSGEIHKAAASLDAFAPTKPQEDNVSKNATTTAPTALVAKTAEEILAALPEEQRAVIAAQLDAAKVAADKALADAEKVAAEKAAAEQTSMAKRLADTEAALAKMKDDALTQTYLAKAKEIGAGDVNEIAMLLKGAFGRDPKEGEILERNLRAMAAQARKGALFAVAGSDSTAGADSPEARLEVEAKKIAAEKGVTFHVAYKMAMDANDSLARAAVRRAAVVNE